MSYEPTENRCKWRQDICELGVALKERALDASTHGETIIAWAKQEIALIGAENSGT